MRVVRDSVYVLAGFGAIALAVTSATPRVSAQAKPGQVVVRVTARDGQPVVDLKREELSIKIDGQAREVREIELVRPGTAGASTPAAEPANQGPSTLPSPYATNTGAPPPPPGAREFLIAVDDEGIGSGRETPVREVITSLIKGLSPADRVGLIAMKPGGLSLAPTTQHAAVTAALSKVIATGSATETDVELACRTKQMLNALAGLYRDAPPARSIVFVSAAMSNPSQEVRRLRRGETGESTSAACEIRREDLETLGRAASSSAAEMFVVGYMEGVANPANLRDGEAGLQNVAGVSGAEFLRLFGAGSPIADRILKTAGTYYVAYVDGAPAAARRVDVQVARDGIRAYGRPIASGGAAAASGKSTPRDMLGVRTVFRDLPLRAAAFVSKQSGNNNLVVMALFEPEQPETKLTAAMIMLFDEKGTNKAQWSAQSNELQQTPIRAALMAPPGTYRLRVAATDSQGRGGTTDVPLTLQLPDAGPVKLGSMIMGTDPRSPKLVFAPADKQVIGFVPIYGVSKDMAITVTYEIRESEAAPPLGTTPGNPIDMPGAAADEKMFWGGFGLEPLQPGDYLMRAVVSVNGKEVGASARTLRKTK